MEGRRPHPIPEVDVVKLLRTLSTPRLLLLLAVVVAALAGGVAIAVAARGEGPTPPPKALPQAIHDALTASPPVGITARVSFTNALLPSSALAGQAGSPLLSGATGRLWVTNDGRGRLELQSNAGDAQITWHGRDVSVYDASSNTDYRLTLPQQAQPAGEQQAPPTVDQIASALTSLGNDWTLTGAQPTDVAGRPAYDVRISPKGSGGLLDAAEVAWDAEQGVPLKVAVYAKGISSPVLSLTATDISFGAVSSADVDVAPPAGAKVVDVPTSAGAGGAPTGPPVTGLAAVQAKVSFPIAAPDTVGGLPRTDVRLVGDGSSAGALVVYGSGLGAVAVLERPGTAALPGGVAALPTVTVAGTPAHELSTPLGTLLTWDANGVRTVLAGSVTPATAEADAAAVR